jgi:hypothetical protein
MAFSCKIAHTDSKFGGLAVCTASIINLSLQYIHFAEKGKKKRDHRPVDGTGGKVACNT